MTTPVIFLNHLGAVLDNDLQGEDPDADPLGVKGPGELVQVGVAPAIANAVFHVTGRRVRELPITAESLF